MQQIVVQIDEKTYRMACAEGESARLADLARQLDERVRELKADVGDIGDLRLMVMAAIAALDELGEARRNLSAMEDRVLASERARQVDRAEFAARLDTAAERIEKMVEPLERQAAAEPGER